MSGQAEAGPDDELAARVGELRRLTILYSDVVGSTELSGRWEPEPYRELMAKYRDACRTVIEEQFEGHIIQIQGDGILATFGFPAAHENDAERAVRAALALVRAVRELSARGQGAVEPLEIRAAVHHGPLYIDIHEGQVYGLAANVGARLQAIAEPGTVVVSDEVRRLVGERFAIEPGPPQMVKGVPDPVVPFRVIHERRAVVQRAWATPLIERDRELERLRDAWAAAGTGAGEAPTAILVSGEAGVGKSRLVAAFTDEAAAGGAHIVELHGSPFHVDAGFHPVRTFIEHRSEIPEEADAETRLRLLTEQVVRLGLEPSGMVPLLAPLLDIAPQAGYEPVAAEGLRLSELIAQAARDFVTACVADEPTIIVAENLHWFDGATSDLLTALAQHGPGDMLILGTSRDIATGPWESIELVPLTEPGRLELIAALGGEVPVEERRALATRSAGIPLYLEELVRADASHAAPAHAAPVPGSVPAALYEPLVARLYETPAAIPVAATAAAAGQEIDFSLLAAAIGLPAEELEPTVQGLLEAHILQQVAGRSERYRFRHELLREVAYELQPPSWRRRVHSRLSDLLTREEPGDWRVVATHFERAERFGEAAGAYRNTAEAARRRGALQEARAHLTQAIDLIGRQPGPLQVEPEVDLRLRRGFLAMSLEGAGSAEAATDYERCLQLAGAEPGGNAIFSTLVALWSYHLSRAELGRTREISTTLRSGLSGSRSYFRPTNLAGFGMLDWLEGKFAPALATLRTATAEQAELGGYADISDVWYVPIDATAAMHFYLAVARFMAADMPGADESINEALRAADALDFPQGPWSAAYAHWFSSWIWIESGRLDEAEAAIAELTHLGGEHGFGNWQLAGGTQAAAVQALAALRSGDPDTAALAEMANAMAGLIELWKALELRVFLPFYITVCGALQASMGDREAAAGRYEESFALAAETGMHFYDAETARLAALLEPDEGARTAALRDALELARSQHARPFELRIALDLHELLGDRGRLLLESAMAAYPAGASSLDLERARARLAAPP